jgi:hypothetical protein
MDWLNTIVMRQDDEIHPVPKKTYVENILRAKTRILCISRLHSPDSPSSLAVNRTKTMPRSLDPSISGVQKRGSSLNPPKRFPYFLQNVYEDMQKG